MATHKLNISAKFAMALLPRPIVALHGADIACIKSSTIINSLCDVVDGLTCNALDADATRITIILDFGKGNCTVEDNGSGIAQKEFQADGGLVKPYREIIASHETHSAYQEQTRPE